MITSEWHTNQPHQSAFKGLLNTSTATSSLACQISPTPRTPLPAPELLATEGLTLAAAHASSSSRCACAAGSSDGISSFSSLNSAALDATAPHLVVTDHQLLLLIPFAGKPARGATYWLYRERIEDCGFKSSGVQGIRLKP